MSPHFHTSSDIYTRQGRLMVLNTYQVWFYTLRYYRGQNDTHNILILIYSSYVKNGACLDGPCSGFVCSRLTRSTPWQTRPRQLLALPTGWRLRLFRRYDVFLPEVFPEVRYVCNSPLQLRSVKSRPPTARLSSRNTPRCVRQQAP